MTGIFEYPAEAHRRRHGPRGYRNYESYKPWLRDDFCFRCVYCLCRERWFVDGDAAFSVDHIRPQSVAPELAAVYENLVYACCQCNSIRGTFQVPDPCEIAYGDLLTIRIDGRVIALSEQGKELADICRLNRPKLVEFRQGMLEVMEMLSKRLDEGEQIARYFLGFPTSMPRLGQLRPPDGNSKPDGVNGCFFARQQRNEVPVVY